METYVRTHLLPYDFSLTAEQEADLFAEVRTTLQGATDDELFSVVIRHMMEELVDVKVQPWREENRLNNQLERVKEIRDAVLESRMQEGASDAQRAGRSTLPSSPRR